MLKEKENGREINIKFTVIWMHWQLSKLIGNCLLDFKYFCQPLTNCQVESLRAMPTERETNSERSMKTNINALILSLAAKVVSVQGQL